MRNKFLLTFGILAAFTAGFFLYSIFMTNSNVEFDQSQKLDTNKKTYSKMKLGAFSISLAVKDLKISKEFYETMGFSVLGGDMKKNYLIMKNENAIIGLFQGMFEGNILTFNPGWDENAQNLEQFTDIREIQHHLREKGIGISPEADENTSGPASFMLKDPDGNVILFDQHR